MRAEAHDGPGLAEVLAVCALFAAVAVAIAVTYARLPVEDLYNVSEGGVAGYPNYPTALAAPALLAIPVDRLDRGSPTRSPSGSRS